MEYQYETLKHKRQNRGKIDPEILGGNMVLDNTLVMSNTSVNKIRLCSSKETRAAHYIRPFGDLVHGPRRASAGREPWRVVSVLPG